MMLLSSGNKITIQQILKLHVEKKYIFDKQDQPFLTFGELGTLKMRHL